MCEVYRRLRHICKRALGVLNISGPVCVLMYIISFAGTQGLGVEHWLSNAASNSRPLALRELEGWHISHAVDGSMDTGWSWGTELDVAQAVFVLDNVHTLTGIRVFSGVGTGRMITRFRLWYATSVPENISNPKFFSGGWGMSDSQWMSIPFLHLDSAWHPDAENIAVQGNIVLTNRVDSRLLFPPLLVWALKIAVEDDTASEWSLPAVLNEFQVIAPRELNPGIDAPDFVQRPARGYIWNMYNASDAWRAGDDACRCHHTAVEAYHNNTHHERASETESVEREGEIIEREIIERETDVEDSYERGQAFDSSSNAVKPSFSWEGALAQNESVVYGTLVARVKVHNFFIPHDVC